MTSYRGDEAIACVGMQPVVEPALGLWDNLKPNRFFGAERKRFSRILHEGVKFSVSMEAMKQL